jgi:hypothetical protein
MVGRGFALSGLPQERIGIRASGLANNRAGSGSGINGGFRIWACDRQYGSFLEPNSRKVGFSASSLLIWRQKGQCTQRGVLKALLSVGGIGRNPKTMQASARDLAFRSQQEGPLGVQ